MKRNVPCRGNTSAGMYGDDVLLAGTAGELHSLHLSPLLIGKTIAYVSAVLVRLKSVTHTEPFSPGVGPESTTGSRTREYVLPATWASSGPEHAKRSTAQATASRKRCARGRCVEKIIDD